MINARPLQFLILCTALFLCSGTLSAHQDRIIRHEGGLLKGLPEKYQPAELDLKAFRLRIGKREMTFTPFLKSLLEQPCGLEFAASWYHDTSTLPPYLLIRVPPPGKDFSYELLFDLDTLNLIHLEVILKESENSSRQLKIKLRETQEKDIRESIRQVE